MLEEDWVSFSIANKKHPSKSVYLKGKEAKSAENEVMEVDLSRKRNNPFIISFI